MIINRHAADLAQMFDPAEYAGAAEEVAFNAREFLMAAAEGEVSGATAAIALIRALETHGSDLPTALGLDLQYAAHQLI